jgi:hypothetical protein
MTEPLGDFVPQDEPVDFVKPQPDLSEQPKSKPTLASRLRPRSKMDGPPKTPKSTTSYRSGMFVRPLEDIYTGIGMMTMPFDAPCGQVVIQQAHDCAVSLDELAKENETVRRILMGIVTTSVTGKVILAHAPILAVMVMHHGGGKAAGVAEQAEQFLKGQSTAENPENG